LLQGRCLIQRSSRLVKASLHLWSEEEIEHVRQLLPKIANGRKTRYKKQQSAGVKPKKKQTKME